MLPYQLGCLSHLILLIYISLYSSDYIFYY
nr:MAG TPA: hypothetical protein [Caudoviricetes sp.]